ncbi:MAG TPA: PAS domain-containing protein [Terriglobales bacterium]|nr:PAS domain-containing protein [Terriglobales bacterium]
MVLPKPSDKTEREAGLDYEALFNAVPAAYLILAPNHPDYTILAVSDAYLQATMTDRKSVLGRSLFQVFPDNPDDPSADGVKNLKASLSRVLASRAADVMAIQKYDIPHRDSPTSAFEERYWAPTNTPVLSAEGEVTQIVHEVEDVSEKVRENRVLMQLAMEHAAIGTWVFDPVTGLATSSEEVQHIFGAKPGEPPESYMFARLHPEDRKRVEAQFHSALQGATNYDTEFRVIKEDGTHWVRCRGRLLESRPGHTRLMGFAEDVTDRKNSEQALTLSRKEIERQWAELETIYRTAPIGLALFDPVEFRYLKLNDRQAEIVGLPPDQILGKTLTEIAPIEGLHEMFEGVAKGEPLRNALLEGELPMRPGEHRYWNVNYEPVFGPDGSVQAITAASLEITSQKRAEQALAQSEKLAVVGRLAASIAHEINTPLESVTNLLFLARNSSNLESVRKYLDIAESELTRVSQIATQTLRFHRQSSRATPTRVYEILDNVLALYHGRTLNAGIKVVKQYHETTALTCFADELRQVFANLISNAIDATPSGGTIVVRKRERTDWRTGRRGVRVTVADSGQGMSAETKRRIFEAFFTTKGNTGTGLGLWVSHGIVEKHGGIFKVRSSQDAKHHGTVFSLFIPYDNPTTKV